MLTDKQDGQGVHLCMGSLSTLEEWEGPNLTGMFINPVNGKPYRPRSPNFLPLLRKNIRKDLIVAKLHSGDVKVSHAKIDEFKDVTKKTSKYEYNRGGIKINVRQRSTKESLRKTKKPTTAPTTHSRAAALTTPRSILTTSKSKAFVIDEVLQLITSKYTFDASEFEPENSQLSKEGTDTTTRKATTPTIMEGSGAVPGIVAGAKGNQTRKAAKQIAANLTILDSTSSFNTTTLPKTFHQTQVPPHIRNELARAAKIAVSQTAVENTETRENSGESAGGDITSEVIQTPIEEASPNLNEILKRRKSRKISKRSGNVRAA
ncbi:hypothetical protein Y032_0050g1959 [Ancylostoma ceylanicum]|uniref:Uncharacterized protein n=1 Tax=Ancylostoma ceylanicum TaxID=53326 RepID=A0A016U8S1_9BILA|nr:hypothetical protein Y032_0050g1959 [Ancylostoma ceylanicum]